MLLCGRGPGRAPWEHALEKCESRELIAVSKVHLTVVCGPHWLREEKGPTTEKKRKKITERTRDPGRWRKMEGLVEAGKYEKSPRGETFQASQKMPSGEGNPSFLKGDNRRWGGTAGDEEGRGPRKNNGPGPYVKGWSRVLFLQRAITTDI